MVFSSTAQVIAAAVGERVAIPLKANATTPYRWHAVLPGGVALAGPSTYVSDPALPMMCGLGGVETFTVVAERRGRYRLRFEHRHIGDGTHSQTVAVTLVAR